MCKNGFKISFLQLKIVLLVTSFMTSSTALRIFLDSLMHSPNVYLEYMGSVKAVSCSVLSQIVPPFWFLNVSVYDYDMMTMAGICL